MSFKAYAKAYESEGYTRRVRRLIKKKEKHGKTVLTIDKEKTAKMRAGATTKSKKTRTASSAGRPRKMATDRPHVEMKKKKKTKKAAAAEQ